MRSRRVLKGSAAALALLAGVAAGAPPARADGLALDRFDPAPAGDRMFGVQSPFAAGELTPHLMLLGEYAHNPLVLRRESGDDVGAIVGSQLFLHLNASLALWRRLTVSIDAPVALLQTGDDPAGGGLAFTSPSSVEFGDLRAGLRVTLWGDYHDPFQIALGGYVWFPTGAGGSFVSDESFRGMPQLIVGGLVRERILWSVAAGPEIRPSQTFGGLAQGTMIKFGGGMGFLVDEAKRLQVGAELSGGVVAEDIDQRNTNAEILFDGRYRVIPDVELGLGVGPGLTSGAGTPAFRAVAMVAYTPAQEPPASDRDHDGIPDTQDACPDTPGVPNDDPTKNGCPPPPDRDHDGILDAQDACPDEPGPANADPAKNGCPPPPDRDHDGIVDAQDACPDTPGVPSADPAKNGCPPDRDGDGIVDAQDACPDLAGVPSADPQQNGCPPDTDGDGFRDDKDACPREKGVADPDPQKNGCPKAVRVTDTEITILQQVQFDTARTTIKPVSAELLDEVAGVLKEHPEITKIEVQGHTDNRGGKKFNDVLSQGRADAVQKALVARGIDAGRLTAKGYGQNQPIADNATDEGRQKNRRVQFKIIEKQPRK